MAPESSPSMQNAWPHYFNFNAANEQDSRTDWHTSHPGWQTSHLRQVGPYVFHSGFQQYQPPPWKPPRTLLPAPPATCMTPPPTSEPAPEPDQIQPAGLLSLPVELRIQIYTYVLSTTSIHILPTTSTSRSKSHSPLKNAGPHPLALVNRQIRSEFRHVLLRMRPVTSNVTNFDFTGLLSYISRLTPAEEVALSKNPCLRIRLHTTQTTTKGSRASTRTANIERTPQESADVGFKSLKKWLHDRADPCRPTQRWTYEGPRPGRNIEKALVRRLKRMAVERERKELGRIMQGMNVRGRKNGRCTQTAWVDDDEDEETI